MWTILLPLVESAGPLIAAILARQVAKKLRGEDNPEDEESASREAQSVLEANSPKLLEEVRNNALKHRIRVFLCHAKEDKEKIRGLYNELKNSDLD